MPVVTTPADVALETLIASNQKADQRGLLQQQGWICPAACCWVERSSAATYWLTSLSYWEFLKWAAFQVPSDSSGAFKNTLGTPRWP